MIDYWNDPPEPDEIPECCGYEMKDIEPNAIMCMTCGKAFYVEPEIDEPYIPVPDYEPDLPAFAKCPHGEEGDCNACNVASDFAYDAARERRFR